MNTNDWPLVFFTVLSQLSVGVLAGGLVLWFSTKHAAEPALDIVKRHLVMVALISMALALILSFLHLAAPLHSIYALHNAGTSWLSREILLAAIFLASVLVCYFSLRHNVPHQNLFGQLYLAALFIGLLFIWSMARVYMIPTVPIWDTPATPISFYGTALILGGGVSLVITATVSARVGGFPAAGGMQSAMFYLVAAAVFIALLNNLFVQPDIASVAGSYVAPIVPKTWKSLQMVSLLAGFTILVYWYAFHGKSLTTGLPYLLYVSVVLLGIAEIAGRYIFYASYYRAGI